jgi:hypothetical protein
MLRREIGEEIGNLPLTKFLRMTFAVEENETAHPIQISLLGAQAVAARAHEHAHLLEQFGLARSGLLQFNSHRLLNGSV